MRIDWGNPVNRRRAHIFSFACVGFLLLLGAVGALIGNWLMAVTEWLVAGFLLVTSNHAARRHRMMMDYLESLKRLIETGEHDG